MSRPISKGSALQKNQERLLIAVIHIIMDNLHAAPENSQSFPAAGLPSARRRQTSPVDVRGSRRAHRVGHSAEGDPLPRD